MKGRTLLFSSLFALGWVACNGNSDNCEQIWDVDRRLSTAIVEITPNAAELSMQIEDCSGIAAEVRQLNISGDFSVIAEFKNFIGGSGLAPYVSMVVYDPTLPDTILDTTVVEVGMFKNRLFSTVAFGDTSFKVTAANTGRFQIRRNGSQVTAFAIAGIDTAFKATTTYAGNPRRIGLRIGTNDSTKVSIGRTGVKFTKFDVIFSNGTIRRDEFFCNSLVQ
jgi:hypothetical protein